MSADPQDRVEYKTLHGLMAELTSSISADPLPIAVGLSAKGVISDSCVVNYSSHKEKAVLANQIVQEVLNKVKLFPETFHVFLTVLKEIPWLSDLTNLIEETFDRAIKEEKMVASPDLETPKDRVSQIERFPYLKSETLSEGERERLLARLRRESEKMQSEFAILVDMTRESLENQKKTGEHLRVLVTYAHKNKLYHLCKKTTKLSKLFVDMHCYWSFFDYEFLGVIIRRHCTELQPAFQKYESKFAEYCQRRLCEIPADVFNTRPNENNNLYVKCDDEYFKIDKMNMKEVKNIEIRLSELLGTELYLLRVEEGCVQLVFSSLCDLGSKFPLSSKQKAEILEMRILRLEHEDQVQYDRQAPTDIIIEQISSEITDHEIFTLEHSRCTTVNRSPSFEAGLTQSVDKTLLTADDHFDIKAALISIADKWRQIFFALGIQQNILENILLNYGLDDELEALAQAVHMWLEQSYDVDKFGKPSWAALVVAVAHEDGGANKPKAEEIAQEHPFLGHTGSTSSGQGLDVEIGDPELPSVKGVPDFFQHNWYHGRLSEEECEQRMRGVGYDCYLIRESTTIENQLVLSLKNAQSREIQHFPIMRGVSVLEKEPHKHLKVVWFKVGGSSKQFPTLPDMINYYKNYSITANSNNKLAKHCPKA